MQEELKRARAIPTKSVGAPALGQVYDQANGLLFWVLGRLIKQGYPIDFADGLDLIHDFYLSQYDVLSKQFDERQAGFNTYLANAFRRFVIRATTRAARRVEILQESIDAVTAAAAPSVEGERGEALTDVEAVQHALQFLDEPDRQLLELRVGNGYSERAIGSKLGTTRYAVREALAHALVKLATGIDERGAIEERDWDLARLVTRDDRPLDDAAQMLGLTQAQARASWERTLNKFRTALTTHPRKKGDTPMQSQLETPDEIMELLKAVVREGLDNEKLRNTLQKKAAEIITYLIENPTLEVLSEIKDSGEFFELLGGAASFEEDLGQLEAMSKAEADSAEAVNAAIDTHLIPRLPEPLIKQVASMSDRTVLFAAMDAIPLTLIGWASFEPERPKEFGLAKDGGIFLGEKVVIEPENMCKEIAVMTGLNLDIATELAGWSWGAARAVPTLFIGAYAKPDGENLVSLFLQERPMQIDFDAQWKVTG